ncbi:MAG: hypothetical protein ACPLOC_03800 [Candidatus Bathyarchaeales archaeon]
MKVAVMIEKNTPNCPPLMRRDMLKITEKRPLALYVVGAYAERRPRRHVDMPIVGEWRSGVSSGMPRKIDSEAVKSFCSLLLSGDGRRASIGLWEQKTSFLVAGCWRIRRLKKSLKRRLMVKAFMGMSVYGNGVCRSFKMVEAVRISRESKGIRITCDRKGKLDI